MRRLSVWCATKNVANRWLLGKSAIQRHAFSTSQRLPSKYSLDLNNLPSNLVINRSTGPVSEAEIQDMIKEQKNLEELKIKNQRLSDLIEYGENTQPKEIEKELKQHLPNLSDEEIKKKTRDLFRAVGLNAEALPEHLTQLRINLEDIKTNLKHANEKEVFQLTNNYAVIERTFYDISQAEAEKTLPEGTSGRISKEFELVKNKAFLFREITKEIITNLDTQKEQKFRNAQPIVLSGLAQVGKSAVLNQIVHWARSNGWIVIFFPNPMKSFHTEGEILTPSRVRVDCYDLTETSEKLVNSLVAAHGDIFSTLFIRGTFIVGNFVVDGRNVYSNPTPPKTLLDLLNYGAKHPHYSGDVLFYLRRELNFVTEYPILVVVDDFNCFFENTQYFDPVSSDYNPPALKPYPRFTLGNIFWNVYNHGMVNGTVLAALTSSCPSTNFEKMFGAQKLVEVPPYSFVECENSIRYYISKQVTSNDMTSEVSKFLFYLSGGRGGPLFNSLLLL